MISDDVRKVIYSNAKQELKNNDDEIITLLNYFKSEIPYSPRWLYDSDAVYFYNFDEEIKKLQKIDRCDAAERGDIMMSFWMPFTYYLQENHDKIIAKNDENIDTFIKRIKSNDKMMRNACSKFLFLAKNYMTRGNMLLLPDTVNKSGRRNFNPERASKCEDKIDQTLFQCFDNGTLSVYFRNKDKNVCEWIKSEHLECLFSDTFFNNSIEKIKGIDFQLHVDDKDINVKKLQPLVPEMNVETYKFSDMSEKNWDTFLDRLNKIIVYRNKVQIESHIPYSWSN